MVNVEPADQQQTHFVGANPKAVAAEAADRVVAALSSALGARAKARLVLAGGSSPRALYAELAGRPDDVDWARVEFYWGDERCVPEGDPASNYHMAMETLLDPLGIAPARIHRIPGELDSDTGARTYERKLRSSAPVAADNTRFDVVLLGMGSDGHIASLFPGGPEMACSDRLAVPSHAPVEPHDRVTLTLDALSAARTLLMLVTGKAKASAVARVMAGRMHLPATQLRPPAGKPIWLLDKAAAADWPGAKG